MIRRLIFQVAVAAVLVIGCIPAGTALSEGTPKLMVEPEKFNFGEVNEGDAPMATFIIKNEGDADLLIHDVKRSCGCTVTKLEKKVLAPGESTTLEATYNSKGRGGGRISKAVTIMTNDPAAKSKVVYLTGNVKALPAPVLTLNASGITQIKMKVGEIENRIVKIGNIGQLDLNIEEITAPPSIKITIDDYVIEPGKTMLTELTIKPGETKDMNLVIQPVNQKPGRFIDRITLRSNNKGRPVTPLAVGGTLE